MILRTTNTASPPSRGECTFASALLISLAGIGTGGCSMSYQLGSLFGKDDEKPVAAVEKPEATGSVKPSPAAGKPGEGDKITDADIAAARAAAANILASATMGESAPWENPKTGARGMVTPLTATYTQDGATCRDFLASVVRDEAEAWLQGEACRGQHGRWIVRSVRPWKRA